MSTTQLYILSHSCLVVNRNWSSEYMLLQDIFPHIWRSIHELLRTTTNIHDYLAQLRFCVRFFQKKTDSLNLVVDIKSYRFEVDVRATLAVNVANINFKKILKPFCFLHRFATWYLIWHLFFFSSTRVLAKVTCRTNYSLLPY